MSPSLIMLILGIIAKGIPFIETLMGKGNGAVKKAAVLGIVGTVAQTTGGLVAANNPAYAEVIGVAGQMIDAVVASHNDMVVAQATPVTAPVATSVVAK